MTRVRILALLVALTAVLVGTVGAGQASAGSGDQARERYQRYALLRERLKTCSLDRTWHHLGSSARKRCRSLRRQYLLYAVNGESGTFFFYCRKRAKSCPSAPEGLRNPRTPPPANATLFR